MPRLLIVSHPAVLAVNQVPYEELRGHGWDPFIVTPHAWRHEYAASSFPPEVLPELAGRVVGRRIVLAGSVQRHAYVSRLRQVISQTRPDVAFVEEEPTSCPAFQWAAALCRAAVPFGLQCDENLERHYPLPARMFRRFTLKRAAFVAARSTAAARVVRHHNPAVPVPLIPHHVPAWPDQPRESHASFVVGFAGRLVPAKGLDVLIEAAVGLEDVVVRLVGNGPSREPLRRLAVARGVKLEVLTGVKHEDMARAYSGFDVLVLPSRTTPTWAEQFGRALIEALWCGVPVIGSSSGEIPWVIESTGGGLVFPESDVTALRKVLIRLQHSPDLRLELAERGRAAVQKLFSVEAVARALDHALRDALGPNKRLHPTDRAEDLRSVPV